MNKPAKTVSKKTGQAQWLQMHWALHPITPYCTSRVARGSEMVKGPAIVLPINGNGSGAFLATPVFAELDDAASRAYNLDQLTQGVVETTL
jgi:hypothetical protein